MDIGRKLQQLENRLAAVERSARLSHASIDNTAVQVRDGAGNLRALVGVQADGTTAVNVVNGPPPPQPSAPIVASVLGGVSVSWDGQFTDGSVVPLDWARTEVHASTDASYEPGPATLQGTIETAQGATVVVSCDAPVYVQLVARNTSGAPSAPSAIVGPFGPTAVVADDVLDGIITTVKLADDAVTAAKVAVNAIDADAIQDAAVTATKIGQDAVTSTAIADGAVGTTQISDGAITTPKLTANAVTANELSAGAVTAGKIATGAVVAGKLDAGAVTAGTIAAGAVQAGNLAANSVQAGNIAADAVQAGTIAANAVTSREINALAVTSDKLSANAVTAGKISAGAVTATSLTVGIASSIAQKITDSMGDASLWSQPADTGVWNVVTGVSDAVAGSTVIEATGRTSLERVTNTPFDPEALYKVSARIRTTVAPTSGTPTVYIGLTGIAADGTTRVNNTGANQLGNQHYVAAANLTIPAGTAWTTVTGYVKGTAATGTNVACPDPKAPGQLHSSVRYIRPLVRLLVGSTAGGTMQVDQVTLETVSTGVVNNVNIADGAITASKIQAGAVDATAIAADAITGKTITGGTITGSTVQTAATGERITLNEASQNKVIVYNASGTAIGELSVRGLLVAGTSGAIMWLDPSAPLPQLRFDNASGTNSAWLQMAEVNQGDANLQFVTGNFAADGFTDRLWRQYMGNDFAVIERVRQGSATNNRGGRVNLRADFAEIGYMNAANASDAGYHLYQPAVVTTKGRQRIEPPVASSDTALFVNAPADHTGSLLRLAANSTDQLTVDKDGNTTVAGMLTAGNIVTGTVTITPSAASTPTSMSVSYSPLKGTTFRGYATAATTVPGVRTPVGAQGVTGVSMSSVTASSALVWVNRENTTATVVNWMVIAS
ncbi:hypothetical protein [Streptomyces mexicanus]|uniref:hypothetical protein n=1 Tax=Streptomyces mexicanus TaxID=178566 RepID=UPI0036666569